MVSKNKYLGTTVIKDNEYTRSLGIGQARTILTEWEICYAVELLTT